MQQAVIAKLSGRSSFTCAVMVDMASHRKGTAPRQASRFKRLRDAGAQVYLCTGTSRTGVFHTKAIVIDAKVAFVGGSNVTYACRHNRDLMLRLAGPPVSQILAGLEEAKANASNQEL